MKRSSWILFLVAALALAGCAGTPANSSKQASADGEYEYVTPVGSNIPVRVRKGQAAGTGMSPTATMSGAEGAAMINSAGGKVPTDKSGTR